MRVMVLSAISRESSTTYMMAKEILAMCEAQGVEVDFCHPAATGLPVNDGSIPWDLPEAIAWQGRIANIDAHIWVSPEYHSGMTGGMKNLFDYLNKEPMKGDVVGLCALAGGGMAALNTLNGMSVIARSLGAWVAPDFVALNSNEVKEGLLEGTRKRVEAMVLDVIDGCRRLQAGLIDESLDSSQPTV
jgi:azobenzene reductase